MTLAELKRAIKPGMRLRVVSHWLERYRGRIRTVTRVQTNGYWFRYGVDGMETFTRWDRAGLYSFPSDSSYRYDNGLQFWELAIMTTSAQQSNAIPLFAEAR